MDSNDGSWTRFKMLEHDGRVYYYVNWSGGPHGFIIPEGSYDIRLADGKRLRRRLRHKPVTIQWFSHGAFRSGGSGKETSQSHQYVFRVHGKDVSLCDVDIWLNVSRLRRGDVKKVSDA